MGNPIGVIEEGGVLNQASNEIEIQCLPADIPDSLELYISDLSMGDSLSASDIELDEKFTLITPKETVLASVTHAMKEIEPVVKEDEDEVFLDKEGEPIEKEEGEEKEGSS